MYMSSKSQICIIIAHKMHIHKTKIHFRQICWCLRRTIKHKKKTLMQTHIVQHLYYKCETTIYRQKKYNVRFRRRQTGDTVQIKMIFFSMLFWASFFFRKLKIFHVEKWPQLINANNDNDIWTRTELDTKKKFWPYIEMKISYLW